MPVRSCRVTIKDMDGVKHTVEVTAETLDVARIVDLSFHHPKVLSGQNTCCVQRTWPSIGLAKK